MKTSHFVIAQAAFREIFKRLESAIFHQEGQNILFLIGPDEAFLCPPNQQQIAKAAKITVSNAVMISVNNPHPNNV